MPTKQEIINMMENQNARHSGAGCSSTFTRGSELEGGVTTVEELEPTTTQQPPIYDSLETRTYPNLDNGMQRCSTPDMQPPYQQYQQQGQYANSLHGSTNQIYAIHQATGLSNFPFVFSFITI